MGTTSGMTSRDQSSNRLRKILTSLLSALITYLIYALVCRRLQVMPFYPGGEKTLVWADAFYQYLDFFGWYKDILAGRQSLWYTFSSSLGQNAAGLFSYYLASPFNLLLVFFPKTGLQAFFNITAGLKLAACSCTMSIYLQERLAKLRPFYVVLLSLCYGLMQYNFSQSSNLMWIDGVYMLPLILLGVYRVVHKKRTGLLAISVGLSVIFCWYTGGINCLAAAMFFPVECCLKNYRRQGRAHGPQESPARQVLSDILRFAAAMLSGLALSAFLFLPTVLAMRTGRGSALDWNLIRNAFLGDPLSVIRAYSPGEISQEGYAALFCGSVPLLGAFGFFTQRGRRIREKAAFALLLAAAVLSLYWQPLFMVFSLLKEAGSYWYRYAYMVQIVLVIMAGHFFQRERAVRKAGFLVTSAALLLLAVRADRLMPHENRGLFLAGLAMEAAVCALILLGSFIPAGPSEARGLRSRPSAQKPGDRDTSLPGRSLPPAIRTAVTGLLFVVTAAELAVNGYYVAGNYLRDDAKACAEYNGSQIELIRSVKDLDQDAFRITQNMTRSMDYHWTTANLNESMGFDYMSVENYTSCPQNTQLDLMDKFGYAVYSDRILPKSTFLQPVDSLLAVRYLLSPYEVREVDPLDVPALNGKQAYRNEYSLPFAFRTRLSGQSAFLSDTDSADGDTLKDSPSEKSSPSGPADGDLPDAGSAKDGSEEEPAPDAAAPFEYWNEVYCALTGSDEKIMEELDYSREKKEGEILYSVNVPSEDYAVYGNLTHRKDANAYLRLNDRFNIPYARWQAVQVFNIPSDPGQETVTVTYKAKNRHRITDVAYYGLNLKTFRKYTDLLKEGSPDALSVSKGKVSIETQGKAGEILFTSIPWDRGWKITLNGKRIRPLLFEDCLICLPLEEGQNVIRMTYRAPGLLPGTALSGLGILVLLAGRFLKKRSRQM